MTKDTLIFLFQSVLGEGCAWGDPNGRGFGTGVWVGLGNSGVVQGPVSVSKYLSVPPVTVTEGRLEGTRVCSGKLGSWRIPLPWIRPLDHLHWPSVLENLSEETSWLQNSQLSPNTGVLSQLKKNTDSRRDMVEVSWMNWVHKYTPPPLNACHFPNTCYSVSLSHFILWALFCGPRQVQTHLVYSLDLS